MINSTTTCSGTDLAGVISQTCSTEYAQSTSTDPTIVNGFSAGEIVISINIFFLVMLAAAALFHLKFRRIKIKN